MQKVEFRILKKKKTFLRNLAEGKIKIKDLPRYCTIVCNIVRLGLQQYEKHSKISSGTHIKMEKNRRQNSCERSRSEVSSSDECISSDKSYISGEESEIEISTRMREISTPESKVDVSFSNSGEEEESI